jgi:hypothetical protein
MSYDGKLDREEGPADFIVKQLREELAAFEPVTAEELAKAVPHIVNVSVDTALNMANVLMDNLGPLYRQRKL